MIQYYLTDISGRIFQAGSCSEAELPLQATNGATVHEGEAQPGRDYRTSDGSVLPMPPRPTPFHRFDCSLEQWVDPRTLQDRKDAQWATIKAARTAAENGGFTWSGSTFDSDPISQSRIIGAVQLAQLNAAFAIDWTLADNTVRTLSAADMVAVGEALGVHVATIFAKAQALRAQIEAATTQSVIESITWPTAPL